MSGGEPLFKDRIKLSGDIKLYSREIGTIIGDGRKDVYAFELVVRNRPGVTFRLGQMFAENNVNILNFTHSDTREDEVLIYIVGDFSKATGKPEEILEIIQREEDIIIEARYAPSVSYSYYSRHLFPLTIGGNRVIMFGPANIYGLIKGLKDNLGEMAYGILKNVGYAVGEEYYNYYVKAKGLTKDDIEEILNFLSAQLLSYGWARMENIKISRDRIEFDLYDYWECVVNKVGGERKTSSYMLGALYGLFEKLYGKRVVIKEVKCQALGDEYCRFRIDII